MTKTVESLAVGDRIVVDGRTETVVSVSVSREYNDSHVYTDGLPPYGEYSYWLWSPATHAPCTVELA